MATVPGGDDPRRDIEGYRATRSVCGVMNRMNWSKRVFLGSLARLEGGALRVECPERTYHFGRPTDLDGTLIVHDERFFRRAVNGADIGFGESYMDGDWTTPDLVTLARLVLRNRAALDRQRSLLRMAQGIVGAVARRLRGHSPSASRDHVRRHYDLGNDFFRLFLDQSLRMYSSGYYETAHDSLEQAQLSKVDRICRLLDVQPTDHVLEIGSGWGGFARSASARYGCRVTTTTLSREQYEDIRNWQAAAGVAGERVEVLLADYRELSGRFDKVVSIEMFEAVGLRHYDDYFGAVDRLLAPGGLMALQTITVSDQWFRRYRGTPDWIETYIFPGGELASLGEIAASLRRATSLSVYASENFGTHYARTLHEWRNRFRAHLDHVRALGFSERFIRMWDFYLGICEAAFLERHTGVFQMLLAKNGTSLRMFNEPWGASCATGRASERGSAA